MKMCFIGYSRANVNLLSVLAVLYYIETCGGKNWSVVYTIQLAQIRLGQ